MGRATLAAARSEWRRRLLVAAVSVVLACADDAGTPARSEPATTDAASRPVDPPSTTERTWSPERFALADRPLTMRGKAGLRRLINAEIDRLRTPELGQDRHARGKAIERLLEHARLLGDPGLSTEAKLFLAVWQFDPLTPEVGRATAEGAFGIAEAAGLHDMAARAASLCVMLQTPDSERWHRWVRTTQLHIELAGGQPSAELQLAKALGTAAMKGGRDLEALPHWEQAVELTARIRGYEHPMMASALSTLSDVLADLDRIGEAERAKRRALDIAALEQPRDDRFVALMRADLGGLLHARGDVEGGIEEITAAVGIMGDQPHPELYQRAAQCRVRWRLGDLLHKAGRYARALQAFDAAIPFLDARAPELGFSVHRARAAALPELGDEERGAQALEAALDHLDPDAPETDARVQARALLQTLL